MNRFDVTILGSSFAALLPLSASAVQLSADGVRGFVEAKP